MGVSSSNLLRSTNFGDIAQLARASALQAEGRRFDSVYLHWWGFWLISEAFFRIWWCLVARPEEFICCHGSGEIVRKVKHSSVRIENPLSALYMGTEYFSLARTFRTVWGDTCQGENPVYYAYIFCSLKRKYFTSDMPLSWALKFLFWHWKIRQRHWLICCQRNSGYLYSFFSPPWPRTALKAPAGITCPIFLWFQKWFLRT